MSNDNVTFNRSEFVQMGYVDVDSGTLWIGDPCYIVTDENEYSAMSDHYFEASGYNKSMVSVQEWSRPMEVIDKVYLEFDISRKLNEIETMDIDPSEKSELTSKLLKELRTVEREAIEKWQKENPYEKWCKNLPEVRRFKHYASFPHPGGWDGKGIMMSTNYGDGSYPCYMKYDEDGQPSLLVVDLGAGEFHADED